MLVAKLGEQRVEAVEATKGPAYHCPECSGELILKQGRIVVAHFAHRPPTDCGWSRGETVAHMAAKRVTAQSIRERGQRAELEFVIAGLAGDRRADVAAWSPSGRLVALELQHTPIGLPEIERRAFSYARAGVAQMWIPFIAPSVWTNGRPMVGGWFVERYSPRPFEKWVQGFTMKRGTWMYDPRRRAFWVGTMADHMLHHEGSNWYDSGGEEQYSDSYERQSKRYRELTLIGPYEPGDLLIKVTMRRAYHVRDYSWPAGPFAEFVAARSTTL